MQNILACPRIFAASGGLVCPEQWVILFTDAKGKKKKEIYGNKLFDLDGNICRASFQAPSAAPSVGGPAGVGDLSDWLAGALAGLGLCVIKEQMRCFFVSLLRDGRLALFVVEHSHSCEKGLISNGNWKHMWWATGIPLLVLLKT